MVGGGDLKVTGLSHNPGQLQGSYRDFQSNCWANLRILGQPCDFQNFTLERRPDSVPPEVSSVPRGSNT
jgi:hypothetical protein